MFFRGLAEVGKPAQDDTPAQGAESGDCFVQILVKLYF